MAVIAGRDVQYPLTFPSYVPLPDCKPPVLQPDVCAREPAARSADVEEVDEGEAEADQNEE